MENRKAIEYLLRRGISPSLCNNSGKTALHYAIELQSLPILCYLCEGMWSSNASQSIAYGMEVNNYYTNSIDKKYPSWVFQTWKTLDYAATPEQLFPLHLCSLMDNVIILKYIVFIINLRAKVCKESTVLNQIIEFRSKTGSTPLLISAQYGKAENFKFLMSLGANIYQLNGKMQNVLHLSITNKCEKIIRLLASLDSEVGKFRRQKDYRGKIPAYYSFVFIFTYLGFGSSLDLLS